jgi:hypothetical protein
VSYPELAVKLTFLQDAGDGESLAKNPAMLGSLSVGVLPYDEPDPE